MAARGMLVARDRESPDDEPVVLRDEDGGVRVTPDCAEVTPLVGDVPPAVRRHEPAFRLGADSGAELGQPFGVGRFSFADDHSTTTPAPPRLGSPAAPSFPSSNVTADAPPK